MKSRFFTQVTKTAGMTAVVGSAVLLATMAEEKRMEEFKNQHPGASVSTRWKTVGPVGYFEYYVDQERTQEQAPVTSKP